MSKHIIVRNLRFHNTPGDTRASVDAQPIAVALYASLSATFPLGESFFVRSVAQFAKEVPADLKTEVDAFIRQEAIHSREHASFNETIASAGLPINCPTAGAEHHLGVLEKRSPLNRLAVTVGLEHFTSVFAQVVLDNKRHLAYCSDEARTMWQWHAIEEIEHKAVAIDVFNHMTAHWSPIKRFAFRCAVMVETMARLGIVVWQGIATILRAEDQTSGFWRLRVLRYLFVSPGLLAAMMGPVLRYFMPGFHPNKSDDSALLRQARQSLSVAAA